MAAAEERGPEDDRGVMAEEETGPEVIEKIKV